MSSWVRLAHTSNIHTIRNPLLKNEPDYIGRICPLLEQKVILASVGAYVVLYDKIHIRIQTLAPLAESSDTHS